MSLQLPSTNDHLRGTVRMSALLDNDLHSYEDEQISRKQTRSTNGQRVLIISGSSGPFWTCLKLQLRYVLKHLSLIPHPGCSDTRSETGT